MAHPETSKRTRRRASPATRASDARLARRAARRDEGAFEAIFRRYHQEIYRFCLSILANPEDARDALQNTMVKALGSLPGENRQIRLKPWLYRVARNESVELLRRRRQSPAVDLELADPGEGPVEAVERRERMAQLFSDLAELPERQRSALVMRELSGLEFAQIGEAFDTTAAVARQTVYEARLSLRGMEQGREMSCEEVMHRLSNADGRVSRRRDLQAHLRTCADCRAFRDGIESRQRDLGALAPLPAIASAGVLHAILGGVGNASGAAAGAAGGGVATASGGAAVAAGAGKAVTAGIVAKSVATVAVVAAVGVTAADRGGLIDTGLTGGSGHATPAKVETGGRAAAPGGQSSSGGAGKAKGADAAKKRPAGKNRHGSPQAGRNASRHGRETAAAHRKGRASHSQGHGPPASHPSPPASPPGHSSAPPKSGGGSPSPQQAPAPAPPKAPSEAQQGQPSGESGPPVEQTSGSPPGGPVSHAQSEG